MRKIILTLILLLMSQNVFAASLPNLPADIGIQKLKDGNYRFAKYQMNYPNQDKTRRERLIISQHPYAIVLCSSDSRIAPELIFDQGLGDLFIIRTPGNDINEYVMQGIEYAVFNLGVNLVVVLDNEYSSSLGAAIKNDETYPNIESIKASIDQITEKCKSEKKFSNNDIIKEYTRQKAIEIIESKKLTEYDKKHDFKVIPAYYCISTGEVEFLKFDE